MKKANDSASLFRNRHFLLLWSSQVLSQLSVHTMNLVLLTRLFELTGSSLATSFLWLAYALPAVLLGPLAGAVVDGRDRRILLMGANLVRSGVVLWLALSGQAAIVPIYGVVLLYSSLNQFYVPAEIASVPSFLAPAGYAKAAGLFFFTQQAAVIVGFSMGGGFIALMGINRTLGLCSGALFLAFVCVFFLPSMKSALPAALSGRESGSLRQSITRGFEFLRAERRVLLPFLLLLSSQGGLSIMIVTIPSVATELLHIPSRSAGLVLVAPFAAGALLGAMAVPKLIEKGRSKRRIAEASLVALGIMILLFITAVPSIRGWARLALGSAGSLGLGVFFTGLVVPSQTLMQERTPEDYRGRVFGNLSVLVNVMAIFPVMLSGTVAHFLGVRFPLSLMGISCLAGVILFQRLGHRFMGPGGATGASLPRGKDPETPPLAKETPFFAE